VSRPVLLCCLLLSGCATRQHPPPVVRPDPAGIETTVLLIGDAGAPASPGPVLEALEREIDRDAASTTVVFLGDNIYPRGMPDSAAPSRGDAERRLAAQMAAAAGAAGVYFIPGNHDWARDGDDGWNAIRRQGRYLAENGRGRMLPRDGCPGPDIVELGAHVRLVLLDTQWWLHPGPRPGPESSCAAATPASVVAAIGSAIRSAAGRHVVVAGHHPLESSGPHGGRFGWLDHVFPLRAVAGWAWVPLPVIGSAYPIARRSGLSRQDRSSSASTQLRTALQAAFAQDPPLVYAAGHEHGLEVHRGSGARYTLVSGAGSPGHLSALHPSDETLFAMSANGFMRVDAYRDGRVLLTVITVDVSGRSSASWEWWLN